MQCVELNQVQLHNDESMSIEPKQNCSGRLDPFHPSTAISNDILLANDDCTKDSIQFYIYESIISRIFMLFNQV